MTAIQGDFVRRSAQDRYTGGWWTALRSGQGGLRLGLVVVAITISSIGLTACPRQLQGPSGVLYENRLNEAVDIYEDGRFQITLKATSMISAAAWVRGPNYVEHLEARTKDGQVVYRQDISGKILQAQGWRIVITDQRLTPTPASR